jgi:hypothetical protein
VTDGTDLRLGDLPKWLLVMTRIDVDSGCMVWTGKTDADGYGRVGGKLLHREVWAHLVAPVQDGMTLDHLRDRGCRSSACWAPWHLQVISDRGNRQREGRRPAPARARVAIAPAAHPPR